MRFTASSLLALAGLAASATQETADVFVFDRHSQSSTRGPRVPKEIARHILLQRTSTAKHGHAIYDLPDSLDEATAISYINSYGKSPAPLFEETTKGPSQLVVVLQGTTPENSKALRDVISKSHQHESFAISNPPSTAATSRLLDEFRTAGISNDFHCDFSSAVNPFDSACWQGLSSVVSYDASKPSVIDTIITNFPRLSKFVSNGDLEAIIVFLPKSSRSSHGDSWHSATHRAPADLRRRDFKEHVLTDTAFDAAATKAVSSGSGPSPHIFQSKVKIPACFTSLSNCANQTNNCSGHGECVNKYGNNTKTCFVCSCKQTIRKTGSKTNAEEIVEWGGAMCQKEDISAQFWLITGFTILIVGAVGFAIGLLFSMGQEKLPGVIGAGVSRSK